MKTPSRNTKSSARITTGSKDTRTMKDAAENQSQRKSRISRLTGWDDIFEAPAEYQEDDSDDDL